MRVGSAVMSAVASALPSGGRFFKMSGSGNDFVFFDARSDEAGALRIAELESPDVVRRLCARGTGVGADGVVFLDGPAAGAAGAAADVTIRYYNADGSRATLCGNATLCAVRLAVDLGMANPSGLVIGTDAGTLRASMANGLPGFELPLVSDAVADFAGVAPTGTEMRLGYATVGVPHVVIRVPDLEGCDVVGRGRAIRHDPALPIGANVNFVALAEGAAERAAERAAEGPAAGGSRWRIRTYERGVEAETLACGTGSVASAILLGLWGETHGDVVLETRSGQTLTVTCAAAAAAAATACGGATAGSVVPTLRGDGRLIYTGDLAAF